MTVRYSTSVEIESIIMRKLVRGVALVSAVLLASWLWPAKASAQQTSGIAGVVKDASGAVLPGVTVEAASPALIEKVRTSVTDGQGQYKIVDLRPGTTPSHLRSPASTSSNARASN